MASEAKETARLYTLLTDKLGSDTTEAMFRYIDNRAERSVESKINSLATKDDIANVRKEIADVKADMVKWMFVFWIGQAATTLGIVFLYLKK